MRGCLRDATRAAAIDEGYIAGFMMFGGHPGLTPYKGIRPVPPGQAVCISERQISLVTLWTLANVRPVRYQDDQLYDDHLRELFREAVAVRLTTPGTVIAELSGGVDSSSVVCMASELIREGAVAASQLRTVSYTFEGSLDQPFIEEVEDATGLSGDHLSTSTFPLFSDSERAGATPRDNSPILRASAALARAHGASRILTGQGGDIVFGNWWDDSNQVSGLLRRGRVTLACSEALQWSRATGTPVAQIILRSVALALPLSLGSRAFEACCDHHEGHSSETSISSPFRLRTREAALPFSGDWIHGPIERRAHFKALTIARELGAFQPLGPMQELGYTHPLVHRPLVEFLMGVPPQVLCSPGQPRRLMRRALGHLWPSRLRRRKSKGLFGLPNFQAFAPFAEKLLAERRWQVVERGWVERGWVERDGLLSRLDRLTKGLDCNQHQLRYILLLESWLRARFGECSPETIRHRHVNLTPPIKGAIDMSLSDATHFAPDTIKPTYAPPQLTLIGDIFSVVLGVAGGGDDFMGYSRPEFEFEADEKAPSSTEAELNR